MTSSNRKNIDIDISAVTDGTIILLKKKKKNTNKT